MRGAWPKMRVEPNREGQGKAATGETWKKGDGRGTRNPAMNEES